ncbi:hypothetical protein DFH07DRAFT_967734 [Mycena maculata]|uniref:Uncharacterized protein n=1 Tax=Mycena maculata TaxID=230809 RepID=A0AAD7MWU1_9AGAR|nr:hypothetical protein DFH07DRAFT_967734 [Mycena maculata]
MEKLNDMCRLLGVVAELEEHKQFMMAVGSGKVTRITQLVMACLNNGVGIQGIIEQYHRACRVVYNPKNFDEDDKMLMLLILRLGGARLAGIVHHALGLPGISTIRSNTVIRHLRVSPGFPTIEEIEANINVCTESELDSRGPAIIVHLVLMLDEIAVERRPRWDDKTNKILGACRECCHKVSLELNTEADLETFFQALDDGEIHLAAEATVAAFGALPRDPRIYSPRPCCISGTDKHENAEKHAELIGRIMTATNRKLIRNNITYHTISITSDGEARHGYHLLTPYMYIELSLHEQLIHLSTAAHLLFILYSDDGTGTNFMVNQTYVNLMVMIKNVFFCVAKTKIDIPDGKFFIILLGTDHLEVLFSLVRTAIGTDSNVNVLQLGSRCSNLTEVGLILAGQPNWDRSPRRLKLPMIINEAGYINCNADHINPASWKGDTHVRDVTLLTAWKQGRRKAEDFVPQGASFLSKSARTPGVGIFSPLGHSLVPSLDDDSPDDFALDPDLIPDVAEAGTDSDLETPSVSGDIPRDSQPNGSVDVSYTPDGDIKDALAIAEPTGKFLLHMLINEKKISKAKALSRMPSFMPTMHSGMMTDSALGAPSIQIGNPVALVVYCEEQLFLAVAQVNDLMITLAHVQYSVYCSGSASLFERTDLCPDFTSGSQHHFRRPNREE